MEDGKIKAFRLPAQYTWRDLFQFMEKQNLLGLRIGILSPGGEWYDNENYICENGDLLVDIDGIVYNQVDDDRLNELGKKIKEYDKGYQWYDEEDYNRRIEEKTKENRERLREIYVKWVP